MVATEINFDLQNLEIIFVILPILFSLMGFDINI